jgi:condensin complex subunit 3
MAKLMLSGIVTDENVGLSTQYLIWPSFAHFVTLILQVLARLVGLFLDPGTADNQALRQCLSYFFPVYCYSSPTNQRRMQQVSGNSLLSSLNLS